LKEHDMTTSLAGRRRPRARRSWRRSPAALAVATLSLLVASLTVGPVPSAAAAEITDGLALWYKLDETSGTVAADASGHNRNGTVHGAAGWTAGQGLAFNGTDTYVKAPDNLLAGLDSITVAMDVLIDPAQTGAYFIYGFGNTNASTGYGNGYLFGGGNEFRTSISTANWTAEQNTRPSPGRNLARGSFKHVTYTQTGTTGVLYEDGVEVGRNTNITIKPSAIGGGVTTANYLGRSLYTGDARLKGRIRDFRVYNRAITAAEAGELAATSAAQGVAQDKAALTLGDTSAVTANLVLPAPGAYGSTITYLSSDPAVLGNDGKVTRPAAGRPDATVTLTATLKRGTAQDTKVFTVKVLAEFDDSTKVNRAAQALVVPNVGDVRGNLTLPVTGADNTTVTWTSDRPGVIAPDGVVHRPAPGAENVRVNLIATVTLNQASSSRTFEALVPALPAPQALKGYLFSYFTGEGKADGEQLYAALSKGNDPLRFRELNGGKPVLTSSLGEKGLRDPFIIRSPEGDKFYQIATDLRIFGNGNWDAAQRTGSKSIMVWESTDLVNWTDQRLVKVSPDTAGNTWAPEAFYDADLGAYVVFWASKIYADDDPNHTGNTYNKMMYATTRDFVTFTTPKVWVDPGYSVIDSTMIKDGETYYRFTKDERNNTSSTPCSKFITEEKSSSLLDLSYTFVKDCIGKGALGAAEGPTILKSNTEKKWYLYLDEFGGRGYVPFESTDLDSGVWTQSTGYDLPASPRHGTVLPVTQAEYDRIVRKYLPTELVDGVADVTARTPAGTAPQLPATVTATFADGSTKAVAVTWDDIPPSKYATAGEITVLGTIAESSTVKARANITVYVPDAANAGADVTGTEGTAIPLDGTSAGVGAVAWTYQAGAGVDAGATCSFADATRATTTFTCTDDGTFEVTLRVGDVTDAATVTVANATPGVGAVTAPGTAEIGQAVTLTAALTDAGGNDTHTCVVDWQDGTTAPGTVAAGTCTAEHTYQQAKAYDPIVTVTDDDQGTGTAGLRIVVALPDSVNAGPDTTGAEGSAIALTGAVTGTATPKWSYAAKSGVDDGATCVLAGPKTAVTTITCTDDGSYEVTLTAGDQTDSALVTVHNVAPKLGDLKAPAAAKTGAPVTVSVPVTDAGTNDKLTCLVDWHDGDTGKGKIKDDVCSAKHTYTTAGTYEVAVSVTDDDGDFGLAVHRITIAAADRADAGADVTGAEGAAIRLNGVTAGAGTPGWTYRPLSGVDTGATCAFTDKNAAATALTCTDDGTYEVRLRLGTASDKARVTVTNANPVIAAAPDPAAVKAGKPVRVDATFTDAGRHDTHTCVVDWTGGVTSAGTVTGGVCTAGHTYTKAGTYQVTVTVTDDDGGAVSRAVRVVVKASGGGGGITVPGGGNLPVTGSPVALAAGIGLLLLLGGVVLLVLSRRRSRVTTQL
jgi:PKD repeat protein